MFRKYMYRTFLDLPLSVLSFTLCFGMTIPAAELDLSGHDGHLDSTQKEAFDQFKKEIEEELGPDSSDKWYDDTTLLYVVLH